MSHSHNTRPAVPLHNMRPALPLPSVIAPDVFMPLPELPSGSSSSVTATPQLQLMAVQCLAGSTSFAASCIEQCTTNSSPSPCSLLLASFYAHALMGAAGSRPMLSCCRLISQLVAQHPQTRRQGTSCNWVT
jgi:hypothetical protein